jgi:Family of unknown function (DUF6500)
MDLIEVSNAINICHSHCYFVSKEIWWIETHKLDHFEKAVKIKQIVECSN